MGAELRDDRGAPPGLARVQADVQRAVDAGEVRLPKPGPVCDAASSGCHAAASEDEYRQTHCPRTLRRYTREHARGRYDVPQEEELADAKRPDIRVHCSSFDAPVPIELKIADNWGGPSLFERLQNQLCGDYLRDSRESVPPAVESQRQR